MVSSLLFCFFFLLCHVVHYRADSSFTTTPALTDNAMLAQELQHVFIQDDNLLVLSPHVLQGSVVLNALAKAHSTPSVVHTSIAALQTLAAELSRRGYAASLHDSAAVNPKFGLQTLDAMKKDLSRRAVFSKSPQPHALY